MKPVVPLPIFRSNRGVALVTVLFMMSLMVVLVVAIALLSRSESRLADTYSNQVSADALSQVATNLVISQIRGATATGGEAWASQPGAIRKYGGNGNFLAGYKLYSDDDMIITNEMEFLDDVPPSDWETQTQHFVDLNEPVITDTKPTFPILDPRAEGTVEGFSFTDEISGTVKSDDVDARLPMPTRWIYILQDGTTGHLDPSSNEFVGSRPNGEKVEPDEDNPIVGRMAFWTDDESGKININTASEPTFWDSPKSVALEDQWYARCQPVQKEFQRYPGHPATTALSTVLFGNQVERKTLAQLDGGEMRSVKAHSGDMKKNRDIKEKIYEIIPRINTGGSESGTRIARKDEVGVVSDEDHLYASLDEFIFAMPEDSGSTNRETSDVVDRELLERARFFLTAHSRAPELNLFGLPRVSIWPTDGDNKTYSYLTPFDKLIRFCSTSPAGDRYFFTREQSLHPNHDWQNIKRNQEVYQYLKRLTSKDVPGIGGNFASKFGADHEQILTEIFDYIRCVNLCDDSHPKLYYLDSEWTENTQFTSGRKRNNDGEENEYGMHGGHGQVSPIRIGDTLGFGRSATYSEVSLIFICCAHPGRDYRTTGRDPQRTGGDRVEDFLERRNGSISQLVHYTNFPPLKPTPNAAILQEMKTKGIPFPYDPIEDKYNKAALRQPSDINHPGYRPENWNHALPVWEGWNTVAGYKNPTNLKKDEMIIQAAFFPEAFIPAQGWSGYHGRLRTVTRNLDSLQINGQPLGFRNREDHHLGAVGGGFHGRIWGGNAGIRQTTNWKYVGQPVRIQVNQSNPKMSFGSTNTIDVEIYANHGTETPERLIQSLKFKFPDADFPTPELQRYGTLNRGGWRNLKNRLENRPERKHGTSARYWWSFNDTYEVTHDDGSKSWRGRGLLSGQLDRRHRNIPADLNDSRAASFLYEGRMRGRGSNPGSPWTKANSNTPEIETKDPDWPFGSHRGAFFREGDVVRSLVPFHGDKGGDFRLVAASREVDESVFKPHAGYFDTNIPIDHTTFLPAGAHYYWRFGNADIHETPDPAPDPPTGPKPCPRPIDGLYPEFAYKVATQLTDAKYHFSKFPDYPRGYAESSISVKESAPINTGDFDNGVALVADGPYINKPDGGNRAERNRPNMAFTDIPTPYFDSNWVQAVQGPAYFSPNRQISSPVMFGSLSTGVKRNIPWQTLLFRPQPWGHPANFNQPHPGYEDLKDHYLLDLFWMPVVEPYAISEPFSTAGKINLNYQILPFTNIKRATGLHAVMKAEEMLIVGDEEAAHYKNWDHALADYFVPRIPDDFHLRQLIDIDETLKQFEDRFLNGEIFKSASEICEVHLVPLQDRKGQTKLSLPDPKRGNRIQAQVDNKMKQFWMKHSPTGDNSRERPYSNLYPRLTTKSNTFRIHVRAQVIKKPLGSDPKTFDPEMESVTGEWRGSTLVERYIDPNNEWIPDYVKQSDAAGGLTLDRYYRFRILHRKRFGG